MTFEEDFFGKVMNIQGASFFVKEMIPGLVF
jgi:hypothetical protein